MDASKGIGGQIIMEKFTVKDLRDLLIGVPDDAIVKICYEGCIGDAYESECFGYDKKDNTFEIGTV